MKTIDKRAGLTQSFYSKKLSIEDFISEIERFWPSSKQGEQSHEKWGHELYIPFFNKKGEDIAHYYPKYQNGFIWTPLRIYPSRFRGNEENKMKTINGFKDHAPRPRPRAVQEAVEHQDEMKVRAALSDLFASCETTSEVESAIEYVREAMVDAFNDAEILGGSKEVKQFGDAFKPLRFNVRGQNVYMLR